MHDTRCLGLVHWDDPEGWNGKGGGRRVQDGEHMYTCGGDSHFERTFRINSWEVLGLSLPLKFPTLLLPSLLPPLWYSILSDLNLSSLGLCSQV